MAWYYILFLCVLSFFIIKTLISWFFGDTDVDFDCDGDIDFDISSMFSFKGILHFLLGFSSYLAAIAKFNTIGTEIYQFSWLNYVIAIVIGFVFMVLLFYLYKLIMKLNHSNDTNCCLEGYDATILINNGFDFSKHCTTYTVNVQTETGLRKLNIISYKPYLKIGENYKISKNEKGEYYI